jgi:tripartite-type tricarboxylate transporter receptor subunit TctC
MLAPLLSTAVAVIVAILSADSSRAEGKPFFAGKTLKILVGMPPGGGVDAYARVIQRHLDRHLAGVPTIIVQNMPGAGSLRSMMAMANAPADGTTIGTFSSALLTEAILAPARVRLDFRDFSFIGNAAEDIRVCYVSSATGIGDWQDLRSRNEVTFGATAAGTSGNLDTAMLRHLFGIKVKQVQGYAGSAEKRLALEKGEIDGDCGGWTAIPEDWLRNGKIKVLLRLSPTLLPGLDPTIPYGADLLADEQDRNLFRFLVAPQRLGRLFVVSGKVAPQLLVELRHAFAGVMMDPAFLEEAQKLGLTVSPSSGDEVDREVAGLYAMPAELIARARLIVGR